MALQRIDQDSRRIHLAAFDSERRALRLDGERADVFFLDVAEEFRYSRGSRGEEPAIAHTANTCPIFSSSVIFLRVCATQRSASGESFAG